MKRICQVFIERFAEKQLERIPSHIREEFKMWAETIEILGIEEIRRSRGYRDEKLKGNRAGQHSSRLSRSYRVIYEEHENGDVLIIAVQEVNKHEY